MAMTLACKSSYKTKVFISVLRSAVSSLGLGALISYRWLTLKYLRSTAESLQCTHDDDQILGLCLGWYGLPYLLRSARGRVATAAAMERHVRKTA